MIDYSKIGASIKHHRKKKGLSQEALANEVSVDYKHIASIENGRKYPSLELVILIANALGVSADVLLKDSLTYSAEMDNIHLLLSECTDTEKNILLKAIEFIKTIFAEFNI